MNANTVVVIGSGLAGYTVIRELRKLDERVPVCLVSADRGDFYAKPMLSNAFAQGKNAAQLVNTTAEKMADDLKIRSLTQTWASAIDLEAKLVHTEAGPVDYGRLVLAVGASPIRLPLAGDAAHLVLSVNNLADYGLFREKLDGVQDVTILGGGLIGCEFANDLVAAGYRVTVFDPSPAPLANLLPREAGEVFARLLADKGVTWRFNRTVASINRNEAPSRGYRLTADDGSTSDTGLVLSAVGFRPALGLAQAAGIATGRGIIVDGGLKTSAADVYALGDCAEIDGCLYPYVMPIMRAAPVLALNLTGRQATVDFPIMPVIVKTPACPVVVQPVARGAAGAWAVEADDRQGLKMIFTAPDGRMAGFVLVGERTGERAALVQAMTAERRVG